MPWLSKWRVATKAGEYQQAIALLERKVGEKQVQVGEAAELFAKLGEQCGEQGQLRAAAACLVRTSYAMSAILICTGAAEITC